MGSAFAQCNSHSRHYYGPSQVKLKSMSKMFMARVLLVLHCRPQAVYDDPIRGAPHKLIICDVYSPDGSPHPTNTRHKLAEIIDDKVGCGYVCRVG